jgi:hypothetical protein
MKGPANIFPYRVVRFRITIDFEFEMRVLSREHHVGSIVPRTSHVFPPFSALLSRLQCLQSITLGNMMASTQPWEFIKIKNICACLAITYVSLVVL